MTWKTCKAQETTPRRGGGTSELRTFLALSCTSYFLPGLFDFHFKKCSNVPIFLKLFCEMTYNQENGEPPDALGQRATTARAGILRCRRKSLRRMRSRGWLVHFEGGNLGPKSGCGWLVSEKKMCGRKCPREKVGFVVSAIFWRHGFLVASVIFVI